MSFEVREIFENELIQQLNDSFRKKESCQDISQNFDHLESLGSGSFGKVIKIKSKTTQKFYALKKLLKSQITELKLWKQLKNEIKILVVCNHPNIIGIEAVFEDDKNICLVLEYFNGKTLFQYLIRQKKLSESQTQKIMIKVV